MIRATRPEEPIDVAVTLSTLRVVANNARAARHRAWEARVRAIEARIEAREQVERFRTARRIDKPF